MRTLFVFSTLLAMFFLAACNQNTAKQDAEKPTATDTVKVEGSYGALISEDNAVPVSRLDEILEGQDSAQVKLTGEIAACCQSSGCWMDLEMGDGEKLKVTFKDYAFFIPKDSKGKTTFVEGVAKKELIPVETLRHYAMDEGKSKEEIAAINEPEWAYTFEAKGVLIKENEK